MYVIAPYNINDEKCNYIICHMATKDKTSSAFFLPILGFGGLMRINATSFTAKSFLVVINAVTGPS